MSKLDEFRSALKVLGSPEKAKAASRFFKSGPGQYGEGDIFTGVTVPEIRKVSKIYYGLPLNDLEILLTSPIHEERLAALIVLVHQFSAGDGIVKKEVCDFYLSHAKWVNNWDLVDSSAEFIVGPWLADKDKSVLEEMAHSPFTLGARRIAMLATFHYITKCDPEYGLKIITILLHDDHDLIQKATGWMLREIGKRCSEEVERAFLDQHYKVMPRTMLRYAIERFPKDVQGHYLGKAAA